MARPNKMSVLKRQRERKKAEKAALKREMRSQREPADEPSNQVATREELEALGLIHEADEEESS